MSKTMHTPGPWDARSFNGGVFSQDALVASVYGYDPDCRPDDRMWANAYLIAAAPELLEALARYVQQDFAHGMTDNNLHRTARDAIAKATGQTP